MKNFYKLWLGELISNIGSGMTAFALSVYIYEKTGSVSYVSLITLLSFMPSIVLSPIGGLLADRYDRRLLMIIGDLFSGLGLVYILWSIQAGAKSIVPIFVGITFSSIFTSLLEPSYRATLTDILEAENYAKASGLIQGKIFNFSCHRRNDSFCGRYQGNFTAGYSDFHYNLSYDFFS